MLKKKIVLLAIMIVVTLLGVGVTVVCDKKETNQVDDTLTIVTSFYPIYIATENIVDGVKGIELVNLTQNQGGCLHDYQLTTTDMRKLENADIFIINGGGMEGFIEEILKTYPQITVIDASKGIKLLGEASEKNAHVWMNPDRYRMQLENITKGLSTANQVNEARYQKNCDTYSKKVAALSKEIKSLDASKLKNGIISFHDAFAYLADALSIPVIHSIDLDKDTYLSAGEVADVIDEVRENNVTYIFSEEQLSESSPKRVAEETGATLCIIDSLVSGDTDKDAYLTGMQKNIKMLKQVLEDE
ncbi:MAG: metal ABC transporter substrate-binding protein [Velocimicrobium sp.]